MNDSRIVDLLLERDEAALTELEAKYGGSLYKLALNICGDPLTAEEIVNDAYFEAWNRIPPHEPRTYLFPFVARLTRALAINRVKERGRLKRGAALVELTREMEECIPAPSGVESEAAAGELFAAVSRYLKTLPKRSRNMFIRRCWYMDPIPAIAKRFLTSESAVRSVLFRVRSGLREYLKKEGFDV